jgi:Ran GTPase-activating protein (RanGAP) involved in mRNA processing and transport
MEVEARNLIVDKVVHDTGRDALIEFRTAHPPLIVCTDCNQCFSTMKELTIHQEDIEYHNEYNEKQRIVKSKFVAVDNAFLGVQGRKLTAHRLLFSPELNGFESRLRAVKESPYRPHIGDPGAHREEQLRRDMLVVGSDPRGGVRPLHSNFALHQQTRSSWYAEHNQLSLKDAITECNYIRDQWADVVTTDSTSSHVEVVFTWMHFVRLTILFKSECNNWKPEIMNPDPVTGKYQISKMLAPGRYRYKYVVDSVERIDPTKSVITENDGTESNYVVVINPKVNQEDPDEMRFDKCLSLRNSALYDGGVWALRNAVSTNSLIEELDLSFNNMSDEGILAVSDICSKLINLHVIKLNGNGFSFDGCRYLCNAFKSSKRIRHMELANNRIGDDGAEVIGGLIKHHTSLLSIILDANFIGDDGVDQLGLALISNRTLLKLSLADNRFRTRGAERLSFHLQSNGSLTELNVSSNPLGPEGVRHFGDLLGVTDSLKHLDISSTQMMLSHSLLALHAITTSIRTNKSLKVLNMKNNNIDSDAALEIAYALSSNRQIVQMDTSFNKIHLQWYQPDMYLKTKLMAKMPTIETSLCRNRAIERDPILSQKFCARPKYPVQPTDSYIGFWTDRRRWKNDKSPKIEYFTVNDAAEKVRITSEDEYVAAAVKKKTLEMEDFLCEENGQMLIRYVVKVINMYISLLRKDIRKKNKKSNGTSPFGSNSGLAGGVQLPKLGESESANYASDDMDDISITSTQQQGGENQFEMKASVAWIIPSHLAMLTGYLLEAVKLSNRQLESIDTPKIAPDKGIDNSVPVVDLTKGSHAEDDILLVVNIAQCETAFSMMGIILTEEYKTEILNTCLVNGSTEDINVKKLLKYYVANYSKLVLQGSLLQRVSGMAKVRLRKPTSIARQMIASSAIHTTRLEARKEFRSLKKNEPKFLCQYCGRRFESMKSLHSHEQKRNAHVKYHIVEDLWLSQIKVVYQAKYLITGLRFPAFYELCNVMLLPQNFSPQIFDDRGKLGRPVGVIEPNQGYRVEDIMGDWMQVRLMLLFIYYCNYMALLCFRFVMLEALLGRNIDLIISSF